VPWKQGRAIGLSISEHADPGTGEGKTTRVRDQPEGHETREIKGVAGWMRCSTIRKGEGWTGGPLVKKEA